MRKFFLLQCFLSVTLFAQGIRETPQVPTQNEFLLEAWRLSNLARLALLDSDYDASLAYSEEAVRYASLSDDYIRGLSRLTPALTEAEDLLRWAETSGAYDYYKQEIDKARADLRSAYIEKRAYNWEEALNYALLVKTDLRDVAAPPPKIEVVIEEMPPKPAQYKVRPWDVYGDCFWNIAKWFYGDPWRWRSIYELNKDKLPEPSNPDWIEIGTVLDLPSASGEERAGFWDTGLLYAE